MEDTLEPQHALQQTTIAKPASLTLYRICLSRALRTHAVIGLCKKIGIELMTEFRDRSAELSLLRRCSFNILFSSSSRHENVASVATALKISKNRYIFNVKFPDVPGSYQLYVSGVCSDPGVVLVSMQSELITVADTLPDCNELLLAGYWCYGVDTARSGSENTVTIREEFGSTLGSHVWDSAVVFTRNICFCLQKCGILTGSLAVELGAGCGLAGIALAQGFFEKIIITDKQCNVPYMKKNIQLNRCADAVTAVCLDWSSETDIKAFCDYHDTTTIDLILASDVLYDLGAAACLFSLLRILSHPNKTSILLCQKIRPIEAHLGRFDIAALTDFRSEKILEEADVIVWKIRYAPLDVLAR